MKKRVAQFPLVRGLNQRMAPQLIQAPELVTASNIYRARSAEWAKRFAFHYLSNLIRYEQDGATNFYNFAKARALGGRGPELVLLDKKRWWSWSPLRQGFMHLQPASDADVDQRVVTHELNLSLYRASEGAESAVVVDAAAGAGYVCTIWQTDQNRIKVVFTEQSTGVVVRTTTPALNVSRRPKVVFSENRFLLFHHIAGGAACTLVSDVWDIAAGAGPVYIGSANVALDLMGTATGEPWYDVQVRSNGNVLIAYRSNVPSVKATEWDPATNTVVIAPATVVAGDLASAAIGWVYNAGDIGGTLRLLTAVNGVTGVVERRMDGATLAQTLATTILASPGDVASITGIRDTSSADTVAFWEQRNVDTTLTAVIEGHTNAVSASRTFMHIGCLATKPFQVDGADWYIGVTKPWTLQPGYFIVPARTNLAGWSVGAPPGVTARILPGAGMALPVERNALSHVPGLSTTKFVFPCARIYDFTATAAATFAFYRQAAYATVDFDGQLPRPISYSRTLLAPGSVTKTYAGDGVADGGFLVAPEAPAVVTGGAGALTGTYQYKAVFTVTDGEGRTWRSAASPAGTVVLATQQAAVTVKHMFLSSAWIGAFYGTTIATIEIYRTKANGTTFFRIPGGIGSAPFPLLGVIQTSTFNDNLSDAVLEQNLPLYTDGGELFNEAAPPLIAATVVGDRVVGIAAERRTSVVASKRLDSGFGLGWHPDLDVPIVADGDNYAVAAMENRTIVFKRQAIYVLTGDWPTNTGTGSLPIAQRVAVGFGTTNASSVRESQDGVWFQDPAKGMCLLTRGLDVVQLGVQAPLTLPSLPALGVEVAEDDDQVRVLTDGNVRIYDYLEKQWSIWTPAGGSSPTCSAVVAGVYYVGHSDGRVSFYNTASFQDNFGSGLLNYSNTVTMRFSLAGVEGVQRIYRLTAIGRMDEQVNLVGVFFDDQGQTATETKASLLSPFAGRDVVLPGTFAATFRPANQRTSTFLFSLSYNSSGAGVRFAALALEYGLRDQPGLRRLPSGSMK